MRGKIFAGVLGAFGLGAFVGWSITADIYDKRVLAERRQYERTIRGKTEHIWALQDRLDHPMQRTAAQVNPNQESLLSWTTPADLNNVTVVPHDIVGSNPNYVAVDDENVIPEGETVEETRSNLQKLIDQYTANPDANLEVALMTPEQLDKETPPFVISRSKYAWDDEGEYYSKITLTYYPNDRVLLDDEDEPINDVARYVGWRSLNQFGWESEDPNVVFVRNRKMETDFEIIREEEEPLPLHVKYGMEKEEFRANKAAGLIKLRQEDE